MASQEDLIHLVRHRAQYFLDTKGVTSVGVGYYVDRQTGEETEELCIQYTVEKKVPDVDLEEGALPDFRRLSRMMKGNRCASRYSRRVTNPTLF